MNKRVIVTGAEGFTGRYLARELSAHGYEVHGLTRVPTDTPLDGVNTCYACDLNDAQELTRVVCSVQPNFVVHLAAIAIVWHEDVDELYRTNLLGTRHLLEALVATGKPLERVLLASSANVYGNGVSGVLDEDVAPAPANDYAVTKLAMEYLSKIYTHRLPIVLARPFNYTGRGQSENFILSKIINHVHRKASVIELGALDVARDFSDVRSVVKYYRLLLENPRAIGGIYNVCSGKAYTLNEVLDMVRSISGHAFEIRINPAFIRPNEVKILLGSRARLDATVGAVPEIALHDTLRWMLEPEAS